MSNEGLIFVIVSQIYDGVPVEEIAKSTGVGVEVIERIEDLYNEIVDTDGEYDDDDDEDQGE